MQISTMIRQLKRMTSLTKINCPIKLTDRLDGYVLGDRAAVSDDSA